MGHFFAEGGVFMYIVLLFGFAGLAVSVVQLALARSIDMVPLIVGMVVLTIIVGMLGSALGMTQAFSAVASASPEYKSMMLAQGISIALNTTTLALLMAALQTLLGAIAATLRRNAKPRAG